MIKGIVTAIKGVSTDFPAGLSYAITKSTQEGLEAFYGYINKHGAVGNALILVCDGWVDIILDDDFAIVGAFTNSSGEGSKGYASVVNTLWNLKGTSIREVRCDPTLRGRLRSALLTESDLEYLSGPLVDHSETWKDLVGTNRLHLWKPAHRINQFRLHSALQEIISGHEDLSEIIFAAYRRLEHLSRQKTNRPKDSLTAWYVGDKKLSEFTKTDHLLKAVGAFRNERGHEPDAFPPDPLELLLLDFAFRLHDDPGIES